MGYLLMFVLFLLVMQFAVFLLPFVLPLIAIIWLISLFKKPNIRVYTTTYSFNDADNPFAGHTASAQNPKSISLRQPREDSIDVEYTERADEEV